MLLTAWPALLLATFPPFIAADETRLSKAQNAARVLQEFYHADTGLWSTAAWWQAANALQVLADLEDYSEGGLTSSVWSSTFANAPAHGGKNFLNTYYDDEGWWALAWIRAYDITGNKDYLNAATLLFDDMLGTGGNATCGGIWWNKPKPQHMTAIANELFISVAAHLANRVSNGAYYYGWASKTWAWFLKSGMVKANNLVQDGLDATCKPSGGFWTYNQGVILGALLEMNTYKADAALVAQANNIANAAMSLLADKNGILHESYDNNTAKYPYPVGHDGQSFKGVLMRNLGRLQLHTNSATVKLFITRNADSISTNARFTNGSLGINWAGPLNNAADAPQQAAGLDALVAAYAVEKTDKPTSSGSSSKSSISVPTIVKATFDLKTASKTTTKSTSTSKSNAKTTSTTAKTTAKSITAAKSPAKSSSSAKASSSSSASPLKGLNLVICPVGDSITVGYHSNDGNGYREYLYEMLVRAGATVDLVGTAKFGNMSDPRHEGWSGAGIQRIQGNLTRDQALTKYKPNILLLHAGTNDMVSGHGPIYSPTDAPVWLETLIEFIYKEVPDVTILVAQIIEPLKDAARLTRTTTYNAAVEKLVGTLAARGKKIYLANSGPWLTTADAAKYADNIHPNSNGYFVLAEGWFQALTELATSHKAWIDPAAAKTTPSSEATSTASKTTSAAAKATSTTKKSTSATLKTSSRSKQRTGTSASLAENSTSVKSSSSAKSSVSTGKAVSSGKTTSLSAKSSLKSVTKAAPSSTRSNTSSAHTTSASTGYPMAMTNPGPVPPHQTALPTISHPQYSFTRPAGFPAYFEGFGVWRRWLMGDDEGPMAVEEYN